MTNKTEMESVHKYVRGKWKDLGNEDEQAANKIDSNECRIRDLDKKSIIELEELINRQGKILKNRAFVSKLKDKGKKLQERYDELQNALKLVKEKAELFEEQNINENTSKDIDYLEWGVKSEDLADANYNEKSPNLSDKMKVEGEREDELNPLELLARHSVEYPLRIRERHKDDDDAVEVILRELEKLEIGERSASSSQNESRSSNYFGDRLLQSLKQKQNVNKRKDAFKTNRNSPLDKSKILEENASNEHSKYASDAKTVQLIPLEESLQLMIEAHKNEGVKMKAEAVKALREAKPTNFSLSTTTTYLNYRDKNVTEHILDEFGESDFIELQTPFEEEDV